MIWNKKGIFNYAFIGVIASLVLVQSVSIINAFTNTLAEAPPNDYLSINGEKSQTQMQNVGQNHFHIIPATSNQQQRPVSPQMYQNETQNTEKTLTDIFRQTQNSTVQIKSTRPNTNEFITVNGDPITQNNVALGSGFVYDKTGHIVTNNHVVEGADRVDVTFVDGNTYSARVIGGDPYTDLAVLQITDNNFPVERVVPLTIGNSSALQAGERVAAIGNPFGLYGSITEGIVSGLGRLLPVSEAEPANPEQGIFGPLKNTPGFSIPNIIQTDAAINPGNSGGPLLNMKGEVIGINTAIFSNTGSYSGVGFAIPSNTLKNVVPSLVQRGNYEHPYLGVSGIDVTSDIAKIMKLNETKGFLVTDITSGGPADKAGIRGGDVLTDVNGTEVELGGDVIVGIDNTTVRKIDDMLSYLETKKVGDIVHLQIFRDNKVEDVAVTLGPSQPPREGLSPINPPLPPDSNLPEPSPVPPGSSNNPLDDFYENCINIAGKDLCDRLFDNRR
jgi:serine protease Do